MQTHSSFHTTHSSFPATRLRRPRMNAWSREIVAESHLKPSDLIMPIFIQEGQKLKTPIASLPDVFRVSIDVLVEQVREAYGLGIRAIALFPQIDPTLKSPMGDEALFEKNLVCRAIQAVKNAIPEMGVIADVALDPYTTHGQDGIVENGEVANDATVEKLCKQAVVLARAGADVVAPSDMMDGRVGAIRNALEKNNFPNVMILSYSAKYASSLYAPFRDAVGSAAQLGTADKRTYQMDFRNTDEAMREIALDIEEGADMVMVKPAMAYLDIVARAADSFQVPVFAYQVSGEYAMVKAASVSGWINGEAVMLEHLTAIKRAGARAIFTYAAMEVAREL